MSCRLHAEQLCSAGSNGQSNYPVIHLHLQVALPLALMWAPRAPAAPCQAWTWWVSFVHEVAAAWTQREGLFTCTLLCHADGAHNASGRTAQGNRAPQTSLWGQRHWRDSTQCRAGDVRMMLTSCKCALPWSRLSVGAWLLQGR